MKQLFAPILTWLGKRIEKRRFHEPPVYIGGCGRSGTTLLLSILSSHPDIFACPKELNIFEYAAVKSGKLVLPKHYRLYRTFITHKIKKSATRYCEKSPSNIHHIDELTDLHNGNFKLIHILRDGRDVILSKHPKKEKGYWVDPERWVQDVREGLKYSNHPNVYTVKYEELVSNFEKNIRDICSFLDIEPGTEILNWHRHATVRENNALFSSIREISSTSVGKWKQEIHADRVAELTSLPEAMELLRVTGYLD